jgi:para-aminobenzoate synthetase component 1
MGGDEVFEAASIREVESHLRDQGFFADDRPGFVADVYLGYTLSDGQRRSGTAAPPEVCELPGAAVRIRRGRLPPARDDGFSVGSWERTWSDADHTAAIEAVRASIRRGDVYQVNLVQHLSAPFAGDAAAVARALAPLHPLAPAPLVGDGWAIVAASPELFLARRGDRVWTRPIKGTRPLGRAGLADSVKDGAEHVMIVDLERNDLARVCRIGSIAWPELKIEHTMAGVQHLVSTVEGRLRPGVGVADLLEAMFPGGSVTGCPKVAALDCIARLEPVGRGASMGAYGRIWPNGDLELALTIRTFAIADGSIHLWVGGGIVWDSDPAAEIEESLVKARPLLAALGPRSSEKVPTEL